ncbi:peroxidase-related enzyme [Streptomyces shenzhenensis]|uniref:peroxidase-related enzyme n=1 Tax=Streptomyces shenzhenensis TaxID=943815 RepID=UPI000EF94D37|nr:peroxidase-related enzyme [Streptomyces shenzhenensis]
MIGPGPVQRPDRFARGYDGWIAWLAEEPDDGFDWAAAFGEQRAARSTSRLSAGDRTVARTMASIEDGVFGHAPDLHRAPDLDRAADRQDKELSPIEREFAAFVTSRVNRCLYCTGVHALRFGQYSGDCGSARRVLDDGIDAELPEHLRVLADCVAALTATPATFGPEHAAALAEQGLDAPAMLDFIHSVAYFIYANRMVLTVGKLTGPPPNPTAQDAT